MSPLRRGLAVLLVLTLLAPMAAFGAGNCSVFKTWQPGDTLSAGDLNTSFAQVGVTNLTPDCMDDYSANVGQMQTTRDPYPSSSESLATSLTQELTALRFVVKKLSGWGEWYKHTQPVQQPTVNWAANGDQEVWNTGPAAAPDNWTQTGAAGTVARDGTNFTHGTFAAAITRAGTDTYLFQRVDTLANQGPATWWRGKTVTLAAKVRATVAARARLAINDGVGTSTSSYHTGGSAFEYLSVTRTLDAAATVVEIRLQVDTGDTTAQFDAVTLTGGALTTDFIPSAILTASGAAATTSNFRGLLLRTHPDATVQNSTVMLVRADAVVYADGTTVTGWDREVAAITASGAGGLDTGSEAASTWYEIWAIGKVTDGTGTRVKTANDKLLLHRAKDWSTESGQSFTTADDAGRALRLATSTATDLLAQGFKTSAAGFPGPVPFADVKLIKNGTPVGNIWLEIRSDTGGNPNTVLATSDKYDVSKIPTTAGLVRFLFRTPPTTADTTTQYHLVLNGDYARSDANNVSWRGVAAGGYTGGAGNQFNGSAWSSASGVGDFTFKVYSERNNTALTFPAAYDQKALLGYVYNNASSNFKKFIQVDHRVRTAHGADWKVGLLISVTTAVLQDLSAFVPPTASYLTIGVSGNTGGDLAAFAPHFAPDAVWSSVVDWGVAINATTANANAPVLYLPEILAEAQSVVGMTPSGHQMNWWVSGFTL